MPRISLDAIEAGPEELQKAWKKAQNEDRKTLRAEDID